MKLFVEVVAPLLLVMGIIILGVWVIYLQGLVRQLQDAIIATMKTDETLMQCDCALMDRCKRLEDMATDVDERCQATVKRGISQALARQDFWKMLHGR